MFGMLVLFPASVYSAMAASNTVPPSSIGKHRSATSANDLKPSECSGVNVTNQIHNSGTFGGTPENDLLLGSNFTDTIDGTDGGDCIVSGANSDTLEGDDGDDVLLGGPDDDALSGGGGTDVCYGGEGNDTFDCETSVE